jgi:hypothetical protein
MRLGLSQQVNCYNGYLKKDAGGSTCFPLVETKSSRKRKMRIEKLKCLTANRSGHVGYQNISS